MTLTDDAARALRAPLLAMICRRYAGVPAHLADRDDLLQFAYARIAQMAARYDPSQASFETFALMHGRYAIKDALRTLVSGARKGRPLVTIPIDSPTANGTDETIAETLAADEVDPLAGVMAEILTAAVDQLDDRAQLVLRLRFDHDFTLREVGEVLGVTESRASQLLARALGQLAADASLAAAA